MTPRPRKLSVASVMMVEPRLIVQLTMSCGMTLGIRWRKMRRETLMPQASVAVMNSCSRREDLAADETGDTRPAEKAQDQH